MLNIYSIFCGLYLIITLGAWKSCHGQAVELENKHPQQQHIGRQGGRSLSISQEYEMRACNSGVY